jgi:hypothetical protein
MFRGLFGFGRPRTRLNDEASATDIADRLIGMGYLKFVAPGDHPLVRHDLVEALRDGYVDSKWDRHCDARDRRGYEADAEDLAEGGLGAAILRMRDVLRIEGVGPLMSIHDHLEDEDDGYRVEIDGVTHVVWKPEDDGQDSWMMATRRLLEIVNALLAKAGSTEHLYGVYGGHDGRVILMTCEMHAYLRSLGPSIDRKWMPVPCTNTDD